MLLLRTGDPETLTVGVKGKTWGHGFLKEPIEYNDPLAEEDNGKTLVLCPICGRCDGRNYLRGRKEPTEGHLRAAAPLPRDGRSAGAAFEPRGGALISICRAKRPFVPAAKRRSA